MGLWRQPEVRSFAIAAVREQQGYLLAGEQQSRQDRYGDGPEAAARTGGNLTTPDAREQQGRLNRYGDGLERQPEKSFRLPGIGRKPHMQEHNGNCYRQGQGGGAVDPWQTR